MGVAPGSFRSWAQRSAGRTVSLTVTKERSHTGRGRDGTGKLVHLGRKEGRVGLFSGRVVMDRNALRSW